MLSKLIYSAFLISLPAAVLAQKRPVVAAENRVLLHKTDTLYQFYAVPVPAKFKLRLESIYHWYRDDKILTTQGGLNGRLLHGDFRIFYPNNNLKENGRYRYGLREGTWKMWRPSGRLLSLTNWKGGHLEGAFIEYNEQGAKAKEGNYKDDLLSGSLTEYFSDGKSQQSLYKKGVKVVMNNTQVVKKDSISSASKNSK